MFESGGIYYRRKNDYLVVAGVAELIKSDIVIPDEINGLPIKEVDACAFQNVDELDSISFSSSMEIIGERAFYSCENLKLVCFLSNKGQTVKIKDLAFAGCKKFEGITGGINILLDGDHIFTKCYGLTKMPSQIRGVVPIGTFSGCRYLKTMFFHGVSEVHTGAFLDCKNVEQVFILDDFQYAPDFLDNLKDAKITCKRDSKFSELAYLGYEVKTYTSTKGK